MHSFICCVCVCIYVCVSEFVCVLSVPQHGFRNQRKIWGHWFCPSTIWNPVIEHRLLVLVASALNTEPSGRFHFMFIEHSGLWGICGFETLCSQISHDRLWASLLRTCPILWAALYGQWIIIIWSSQDECQERKRDNRTLKACNV